MIVEFSIFYDLGCIFCALNHVILLVCWQYDDLNLILCGFSPFKAPFHNLGAYYEIQVSRFLALQQVPKMTSEDVKPKWRYVKVEVESDNEEIQFWWHFRNLCKIDTAELIDFILRLQIYQSEKPSPFNFITLKRLK